MRFDTESMESRCAIAGLRAITTTTTTEHAFIYPSWRRGGSDQKFDWTANQRGADVQQVLLFFIARKFTVVAAGSSESATTSGTCPRHDTCVRNARPSAYHWWQSFDS